jgi:hypothetical protein
VTRQPGGEVLLPAPKRRVRRRPPELPPADLAAGIAEELRPLAGQVPPLVLGAAVRKHMGEMARLIGWLRD